ncbi:MAG: DUF1214 domain-containing protein [Mangrovicoccus sp.]|nr:DUF1214 domain-containing protein [Mangrovicoccus sp.]
MGGFNSMLFAAGLSLFAMESALADAAKHVDLTKFNRAETDTYLTRMVEQGAFAQFIHERDFIAIDAQDVIRSNRDTLYSFAVFDLSAPVTITLPEGGGRYQSLHAINQDHYTPVVEYGPGSFEFTQQSVGSRYLFVLMRTFVEPGNAEDIAAGQALQDGITITQADPGSFEVPNWDKTGLDRTRDLLIQLNADYRGTSEGTFGAKDEVDPLRHVMGTAIGWAGLPPQAAIYESIFPAQNDGKVPHGVTVSDVPVGAFWSVTVYNAEGFMVENEAGIYSLNNLSAEADETGVVTIHFGGCEDGRINCIPVPENWNYTLRMYQPGPEILDGSWVFPEAQPVE